MSAEWYVMKEDRELGPYSWEEMLEMAGTGELKPEDLIFTESFDDWTEAEQVEGLFGGNLPAAYDEPQVPTIAASVPVPAALTPAALPARRITLTVILIALAILLLSGGALAYFLNRGDSEIAEEIYLVTPEGELIATGQSAKTTGPPLYSLGPGRVPAGFSRTTPADPEDDELPPLDPATPQHSVYNVLLNQPSPSTLPVGTPVGYSFNYLTTHSGSVRISGIPLRGGSTLRDIAFNPPVDYSTGRGGGSGFFTVRSAGPVDGFRIRMYAAGTDTVLHERVYDLNLTFTPLVGEAPPDADPDPDPADPDPGPGAPEEPVPPDPPDDVIPDDGDAPGAGGGPSFEPIFEEGPGFVLPGDLPLPGVVPANAIFNVRFDPPNGTYPINTIIRYTFNFTTSETDRVRLGGYPRDIDLITASYMTTEEFTRPPHEGVGAGFFRVNTALSVRRFDLHIFKADFPHELIYRELIDVNYTFE